MAISIFKKILVSLVGRQIFQFHWIWFLPMDCHPNL